MVIRRPSGQPYKTSGSLQQFDPGNSRQALFNKWDAEIIRLYGSPIFYHEIFISISNIDKLYLEDRSKVWSQFPIELHAVYEPIPSQNAQGMFGIDAPDEMVFEMNYREVLDTLGHPPKIGARLFSPHKNENWVIIQRNLGEFQGWGCYRIELICQRFQESLTTGEGQVTQPLPDFEINPTVNPNK